MKDSTDRTAAALLGTLVIAVYARTLANGFVVDDIPFIQQTLPSEA